MSKRRTKERARQSQRRQKAHLRVGVDIPTPAGISALLGAAEGRYRPLLVTAAFTGMRASELRGLRWSDVDLREHVIHVRQRADKYQEIGMPKSDAGQRTIPIGANLINTLREWRLGCPKGDLDLVFPNGEGNIEWHPNIIKRGLIPPQVKAVLMVDTGQKDGEGRPIMAAKYTGPHSLRHFFASWCINQPQHGGLGLPPEVVGSGAHGPFVDHDDHGRLWSSLPKYDRFRCSRNGRGGKLLSAANATWRQLTSGIEA